MLAPLVSDGMGEQGRWWRGKRIVEAKKRAGSGVRANPSPCISRISRISLSLLEAARLGDLFLSTFGIASRCVPAQIHCSRRQGWPSWWPHQVRGGCPHVL